PTGCHCSVPVPPGGRVIRQTFLGNVSKRLKSPGVSLSVERWIVGVAHQLWDRCKPLLASQHSRFSQAAGSTLANDWRRIVVHGPEQRSDGWRGADQRQSFDGPAARVCIGVLEMAGQ